MPAPKKLVQSSSSGMPPLPPRDMHPASSKPASKVNEQNTAVLRSETVPDPLVKRMEYGDDDDEDENSVERASSQNRQATPATPKPFWSL